MIGLLAPLLGLPKWAKFAIGGALIALALGALWLWLDHRERADDKANQEIGATIQREGDLRETIERTETGNAARDEINQAGTAGDRLRFEQCMRTARTPANCQRFLPERQADQR